MESIISPEKIIEVLQKSSLFGSLTSSQLREIVPLFKVHEHGANELIIKENEIPIDLYVIGKEKLRF